MPPIDPLFAVHPLNPEGMQKAEVIADAFNECLLRLQQVCAEGREFAIVRTKLEEASFFAKKAMAKLSVNQQAA